MAKSYKDPSFFKSAGARLITIFSGRFLGCFENIINFLIPYVEDKDWDRVILDTYTTVKEDKTP